MEFSLKANRPMYWLKQALLDEAIFSLEYLAIMQQIESTSPEQEETLIPGYLQPAMQRIYLWAQDEGQMTLH